MHKTHFDKTRLVLLIAMHINDFILVLRARVYVRDFMDSKFQICDANTLQEVWTLRDTLRNRTYKCDTV